MRWQSRIFSIFLNFQLCIIFVRSFRRYINDKAVNLYNFQFLRVYSSTVRPAITRVEGGKEEGPKTALNRAGVRVILIDLNTTLCARWVSDCINIIQGGQKIGRTARLSLKLKVYYFGVVESKNQRPARYISLENNTALMGSP